MDVYTFYRETIGVDSFRRTMDQQYLEKWKESWSKYGWNPIVLGMNSIEKDDLYEEYKNTVLGFPTVNDIHYELSCYLRWFSLLSVEKELIIFSNYDVYNYGFKPHNIEGLGTGKPYEYDFCIISYDSVLEFIDIIFDSKYDYDKYLTLVDGNQHMSDLLISQYLTKIENHPFQPNARYYEIKWKNDFSFPVDVYKSGTAPYFNGLSCLNGEELEYYSSDKVKTMLVDRWNSGIMLNFNNHVIGFYAKIFCPEFIQEKYNWDLQEPMPYFIPKLELLEQVESVIK